MISYRLKQDIVTDTVRQWIAEGKYRPGDRLPTDSDLSGIFQMNKRTIGIGLNRLVSEHILERAPRRGTVVVKSPEHPLSRAVPLVAVSKGDVYEDLARRLNLRLQERGLYPVLLNSELVWNTAEVTSFLNCMTEESRPYGILAIGDTKFPYQLVRENTDRYANIVFIFRYHYPEDLPCARYVLTDYADCGRQVVEYFAARGHRRIAFPACPEGSYMGLWSSMQVCIMQSIAKHAAANGLFFDEGLFWRLYGGAPLEETLASVLASPEAPTGIFAWSDSFLANHILKVVQNAGLVPQKDILLLGQFNTPFAEQYHFDSFDVRVEETANLAVDMLTNSREEKRILLPPSLSRHAIP